MNPHPFAPQSQPFEAAVALAASSFTRKCSFDETGTGWLRYAGAHAL
jgi:hypothetical protein